MTRISEILAGIDDVNRVVVPTPEWPELDGKLFARRMTPAERQAFWEGWSKLPKTCQAMVAIVVLGTFDADGNRAFDDSDADMLASKASAPIDRISAKIDSLNIVTRSAELAFEKNYETPQSCKST